MHTRSRHEQVSADDLRVRVGEVFLPRVRAVSRRTDRRKLYDKVLFPGYVFVRSHMTREDRVAILRARGVAQILGGPQGPLPCQDHEIASIRILVDAAPELTPVPRLARGQLVLVDSGPLEGVIGRVARDDDGRRQIVCSIDLLGRAVAAHLDRAALEVLPEDPRILPDILTP